jgi:hypothetical protein
MRLTFGDTAPDFQALGYPAKIRREFGGAR